MKSKVMRRHTLSSGMSITLVTKYCHKCFLCLILITAVGKGRTVEGGDTSEKGTIKEPGLWSCMTGRKVYFKDLLKPKIGLRETHPSGSKV